MNAVSRVWSAVEVYVQAISFLLALFCVFSVATPQVHASTQGEGASSPLISAAAYLDRFVIDMGLGLVVVGEMLTGQGAQAAAVGSTASLTSQQVSAILSLLQSFGADQKTVSNVELVLKGADKQEIIKATGLGTVGSTAPKEKFIEKPSLPLTTSACAVFARTLKRGVVGEDVAKLQQILKGLGDFKEASTTTYFGPATEAALKQWQVRMNIVASGDAETTGFGSLGPKTRELLGVHCKGPNGNTEQKEKHDVSMGTSTPVCILKADKNFVEAGTSVVLTWESKNATYAGSATGEQMQPHGTVTVTPTENTLYVKKVYGPQGEGSCQTAVEVSGSQTKEIKVVWNPFSGLAGVLSNMQVGAVVLAETYESLLDR